MSITLQTSADRQITLVAVEGQIFNVDASGVVVLPTEQFAAILIACGLGFRYAGRESIEVSDALGQAILATAQQADTTKLTQAELATAQVIQSKIGGLRAIVRDQSKSDDERTTAQKQLDAIIDQLEPAQVDAQTEGVVEDAIQTELDTAKERASKPEITAEQRAEAEKEVARLSQEFEDRQKAAATNLPQPRPVTS